jgi:thiopeptide-type bacteriocin biosynthesis protein
MSIFKKIKEYEDVGFFTIRSPNWPSHIFTKWCEGASPSRNCSEVEFNEFKHKAVNGLVEFFKEDRVKLAMEVAHSNYEKDLDQLSSPKWNDLTQRSCLSFARYLSRMTTKTVPLGLFTGQSVGKIGTKNSFTVKDKSFNREPLEYNYWVYAAMLRIVGEEQPSDVRYKANTSVDVSEDITFISLDKEEKQGNPSYITIERDPLIERIIEKTKKEPTAYNALVDLCQEMGLAEEDAREVISDLVSHELLFSTFELSVTGDHPAQQIIDIVSSIAEKKPVVSKVLEAMHFSKELVEKGGVATWNDLEELKQYASDIGVKAEGKEELINCETQKMPKDLQINTSTVSGVKRSIATLMTLSKAIQESEVTQFAEEFTDRYGDRFMPLLEVLDERTGIGFPTSKGHDETENEITKTVQFQPSDTDTTYTYSSNVERFRALVHNRMQDQSSEINISSKEIEELFPFQGHPNLSCSLSACLTPRVERDDQGKLKALKFGFKSFSFLGTVNMLGRFCTLDKSLEKEVVRVCEIEQKAHPNAILAEVSHTPSNSLGAVLRRPHLRDYEIDCRSSFGDNKCKTIKPEDLIVGIHKGEFVLWSTQIHKRVLPNESTALNYIGLGRGLYRFLRSLQTQNSRLWPAVSLDSFPHWEFIPRISLDNSFVLIDRTWRMPPHQLREFTKLKKDYQKYNYLREWMDEKEIPRYVYLHQERFNTEYAIDLYNPIFIDELSQAAARYKDLVVTEAFIGSSQLALETSEGRFLSEIVLPLFTPKYTPPVVTIPAEIIESEMLHKNDWLYFKIFARTSDFKTIVATLVRELNLSSKTPWFYISYFEKYSHLRLRIRPEDREHKLKLFDSISTLLDSESLSGLVFDYETAPYQPEYLRYGGEKGVAIAEKLFWLDSQLAISIFTHSNQEGQVAESANPLETASVLYIPYMIDNYLSAFQLSDEDKVRLMNGTFRGFESRFLKRLLHRSGAKRQQEFVELFGRFFSEPTETRAILDRHFEPVRDQFNVLCREYSAVFNDKEYRDSIVSSLIHMIVNRSECSLPNQSETLIYRALHAHYSMVANRKEK